MNWDGYTIFSLLSGLVLLLLAIIGRDLDTKDRAYGLVGGVFFGGYGIYVANQTTGTYFFPVWIFLLPFLGAGYLLRSVATPSQRADRPARPPSAAVSGNAATSDGNSKWICPECRELVAAEALARHPWDCADRRVEAASASRTAASDSAAKRACPDCGKLVAGDAWTLHPRYCSGRKVETATPGSTPASGRASLWVCPDCGKPVAADALVLHHQHCGGRRAGSVASTSAATSNGNAKSICPDCGKPVAAEALTLHPRYCADRKVETTDPNRTPTSNPAAKSICPDCSKLVAGNAWGLHHQHCAGRKMETTAARVLPNHKEKEMAAKHKFARSSIQITSCLPADRVAEISLRVGESTKKNGLAATHRVRFEGANEGRTNFSIRALGDVIEFMTFHVSITEADGRATVSSHIDSFKTKQEKLFMLIPLGPKEMISYKTYRLFMENLKSAVAAADANSRAVLTETTAV